MDKQAVISYFDRMAPGWDEHMVRNEEVIRTILDNARISAGVSVLDVACGTGVLIPDYLSRGAASVVGIDISPEMARIAESKFSDERVAIVCGDVETYAFGRRFDRIMVYNAFPHFPDPEKLVERLASLLEPGGWLSVAHGRSREKINAHHTGSADEVSRGLLSAEELSELFSKHLELGTVVSDDRMYQVTGKKA